MDFYGVLLHCRILKPVVEKHSLGNSALLWEFVLKPGPEPCASVVNVLTVCCIFFRKTKGTIESSTMLSCLWHVYQTRGDGESFCMGNGTFSRGK